MSEKRPRVLHACDLCRRRKIKCDGVRPSCDNCTNSNQDCVYTEMVKRPRAYKKKKSDVKELEGRLSKIESLLESIVNRSFPDGASSSGSGPGSSSNSNPNPRNSANVTRNNSGGDASDSGSGLDDSSSSDSHDEEDSTDGTSASEAKAYKVSRLSTELGAGDDDDDPTGLTEHSGVLGLLRDLQKNINVIKDPYIITNLRTTETCQSTLSIPLLSDKGLKWVEKKTGDVGLGSHLMDKAKAIFVSFFSSVRPYMDELDGPPKPIGREMAYLCLRYYDFSPLSFRAIVSKEDISDIVNSEFSDTASSGTQPLPNGYSELLLLSSYIATILFTIREVESLSVEVALSQEQLSQAIFDYTSIALKYFTRVLFTGHSLNTAKGCVSLVMILKLNHGLHFSDAVMSMATKLVYELGLNKAESLKGLSDREVSERLFLFWAIYWFDQEAAMLRGISTPIAEYDITIPNLSKQRLRNDNLTNYHCLCSLLKIMGSLHRRFFSNMSKDGYQMDTIKHVIITRRLIYEWRQMLPEGSKLDPDAPCNVDYSLPTANLTTEDMDIVANKKCALYLNCCYYHTLLNIHSIPAYHPEWASRFIDEQKDPNSKWKMDLTSEEIEGLRRSDRICLDSARNIIKLMREHHEGTKHLDGLLFLGTVGMITVFTKVLIDSKSTESLNEVRLMQEVCEKFQTKEERIFPLPSDTVISFWETLIHVAQEAIKLKGSSKDRPNKYSSKNRTEAASLYKMNNNINSLNSNHLSPLAVTPSTNGGGMYRGISSPSSLPIASLTNPNDGVAPLGQLNYNKDTATSSPSSFNGSDTSALGFGSVYDPDFAESLHQFSSFLHSLEEVDFFYTQPMDN